jgi:hypothetical protein
MWHFTVASSCVPADCIATAPITAPWILTMEMIEFDVVAAMPRALDREKWMWFGLYMVISHIHAILLPSLPLFVGVSTQSFTSLVEEEVILC